MRSNKTRQLTILALMTAMLVIFSFTPIGSIPVGPLVISLNVIPLAISAIVLGPRGGLVAGCMFGILSFLQALGIGIPSGMGAILVGINPVLAFIQRFVPRALDGLIIGFVFQLIGKKNKYAACAVTGFLAAFLNTVFFMGALVLLFGNTEYLQGLIDGRSIIVFICSFVGVNAVVEMVAATLVAGAVGFALYRTGFIRAEEPKAAA